MSVSHRVPQTLRTNNVIMYIILCARGYRLIAQKNKYNAVTKLTFHFQHYGGRVCARGQCSDDGQEHGPGHVTTCCAGSRHDILAGDWRWLTLDDRSYRRANVVVVHPLVIRTRVCVYLAHASVRAFVVCVRGARAYVCVCVRANNIMYRREWRLTRDSSSLQYCIIDAYNIISVKM